MSPPSHDADVLVLGAGLSGLVIAFRLTLAGLRVAVLEARSQPGGVIATVRHAFAEGEALIERGPNSAMDTSPRVNALLRDLGLQSQRIDAEPAAARRYVLRGSRLMRVPTSPGAFLTTRLLSTRAKLRLLREPFIAGRRDGDEESVAAFVRRRLGPEVLDYAVEPLVGGIYAGDPARLSLPATFPMLAQMEAAHGGLLRGLIFGARARRRARDAAEHTPKTRATSFNFTGGMQTLTDTLARHLPQLACGSTVHAVHRRDDGGYAVEIECDGVRSTRHARALVLALPAHEAARLVAPLGAAGAAAAQALAQIHYPPMATVSVAYRRRDVSHRLDGFGFLAPRVEQPPVLGTLFVSSMFRGRTPEGTVLLTSFVGGRRDAQAALAPPSHLAADVVRCNAHLLGAEPPLFTEVSQWPHAIPQTDLGHAQRLASVATLEQQLPGLMVCGSWRDGVSISDCIEAGDARAAQVVAALPTRGGPVGAREPTATIATTTAPAAHPSTEVAAPVRQR
ncbi:MAG: protoporphyrinogen oxidase [Burkholderiaceae bacterium]|jgi:oxygen-dependent protoporphyrinogen oxidase|nr:protoporphyrinogen oxidase [Burkholderiaceae bacterium]